MMSTTITQDLKLESLRLFQDYQKSETSNYRNQLVKLNLGLVKKEAYYWMNQCQESYEDLVQVGCLGLLRAIERFDLTKGHAFSSFAIPYIRGEIQHYLRDKSLPVRIPRRWLEIQKQSVEILQVLRERLNRQPTDAEVAQALEIPVQEWQEIKLAYKNREPLSLDVSVGNGEDDKTSLGDLVPDSQYRSFQLAEEDKIRLHNALEQLEDRTRQVLEFVFFQDLTQKETAELLGISVVTVSRRIKTGIDSLKKLIGQE